MWIPRWLGEIYSKLWVRFEKELFSFSQAKESLGIDEDRLTVGFSKLHSERLLTIFKRSRPRQYRLLEPSDFILLSSNSVENIDRLKQERYLPLVLGCFRHAKRMFDVKCLAVYGSVARGSAEETSDVDLLIVSDDFHGSFGERIEKLMSVEASLEGELSWLRRNGIHTGLSFYPLRTSEAERLPSLFLDLTEDAVILLDRGRFLEELIADLRAKLLRQGAVRIFVDRERWYWDLKPDYKFGEIIEIP